MNEQKQTPGLKNIYRLLSSNFVPQEHIRYICTYENVFMFPSTVCAIIITLPIININIFLQKNINLCKIHIIIRKYL